VLEFVLAHVLDCLLELLLELEMEQLLDGDWVVLLVQMLVTLLDDLLAL
jgi:hypothetical protein